MLRRLTVSNLAIVEGAEAEFGPGLNVITGETGAGKSVLMGALDLVLGGRADASVVRDGAKEAEVTAAFDEHEIRRTVTAQGRSRAWIDDESVSVAELRDVGRSLVDIHGPTANQRLVEEAFQRETLDAFGGLVPGAPRGKVAAAYADAWARLVDLRGQLEAAGRVGGADEADMLRFQVNELEDAALGEADETLAGMRRRRTPRRSWRMRMPSPTRSAATSPPRRFSCSCSRASARWRAICRRRPTGRAKPRS